LLPSRNFVYPGKLASFRLRARWIRRYRSKRHALTEIVHGFENLSSDPAVKKYLTARNDPAAAWELTPRSVASLFGFKARATATAPPLLLPVVESDNPAADAAAGMTHASHHEATVADGAAR
jgi:hypothetical protein